MSHAIVHILSRKPMTWADLNRIMEPYYEGNVFPPYEEDEDGNEIIKTIIHPQFQWDYFSVHDPILYHDISDCYALIDPDGWCIARKWWNGRKWIDQTLDFEVYINEHRREWEDQVYMTELDIHW